MVNEKPTQEEKTGTDENPAGIDKDVPQTEAKNAALEKEQDEANEQEPQLVTPDEKEPIKSDKAAVDAILEYLDGFGGPLSFELSQVKHFIFQGRNKGKTEAEVEEEQASKNGATVAS